MPYTTVVAGTTITASWANTNIRDQVVNVFADASTRNSQITSPVNGMLCWLTTPKTLTMYNGSAWVCISPQSAAVTTQQTTTSTTYTDLATTGPAVTLETGTSALVTLCGQAKSSTTDVAYMGVAVSGASTVAASDTQAAEVVGTSTITGSMTFLMTGLTAGSNTFTAKYRTPSGTATYANRNITVVCTS